MPTPNGSTPSTEVTLSNNLHINSLVYGTKWGGTPGTSAALSYSFLSSSSYYATDYSSDNEYLNSYQLTNNQKTAVTQALDAWAAVANISFSPTIDSNANAGDLRFGGYAGMDSSTAAWGYFPNAAPVSGDVWIGPATAAANPTAGTYDYLTFVHEIGHALGLKHPFKSDGSNSTVLPAQYDDVRYTVMSYTDPYSYEPTTPMLLDIAAIQYLYGANMQWHTGNDTYQWSAGKPVFETIWDAGGIDTLNASNQSQAVTLNLNPGTFSNIGATFWSGSAYINNGLAIAYGAQIEHAVGSAYADTLIGNTLANVLNGGAGADQLLGGDGSDSYYVDNTGDTVSETNALASSGGTDSVYSYLAAYSLGANVENLRLLATGTANGTGNSLNNLLYAGAGNNKLDGGAGIDTASYVYAASAVTASLATTAAQATGGSGSDTLLNIENLTGSNFNDKLTGNAVANVLNGSTGNDTLVGGLGSDIYVIDSASDVISETSTLASEIDTVQSSVDWTLNANLERLTLIGSAAINGVGNALNNTLIGNAAGNILNGGSGNDTLVGGLGSDAYIVDSSADVANETSVLTSEIDSVWSSVNWTLGANFESLVLIGSSAINGTGNTLNNTLYASAGNNVLNGGAGVDLLNYDLATAAVSVSLASTAAQATGGSGSDTLLNFENLTGSNFNDILTGNTAANTLSGGAGNDVLNGGAGADRLIGGDGSDIYYVDNTGDIVSETNAVANTGGTDTVYSSLATYTFGANVENLRLLATGAANGTGNSLNNLIYAGAGNNSLDGSTGIDTASYAYAGSAISASLASTTAQATGGSGSDTLLNFENLTGGNFNDVLTGNTTANTLIGGAGNDTLNGGAGNDLLLGGSGVDRLNGGSGADSFDFNAVSELGLGALRDVLGDFKTSEGDKIDLSTLDANTVTTTNEAFSFIGSNAFGSNAAGQLRFASGVLYGSTDADSAAEFEIQLLGVSTLNTTDLIA